MSVMVEVYGRRFAFRPMDLRTATVRKGLNSAKMLRQFHKRLSVHSYRAIGLLSLVLILLVAALDHVTGYEMSFSIFFLIPILIAVGYGDQKMGYAASILSAGAWMTVEKIAALPYS
ncbi:MAG TPA: hypothetical protein VF389_02580, partial [Woeseiaceae bacterium]